MKNTSDILIFLILLFCYTNLLSYKVVIDPGHGGKFLGVVSANKKLFEKDLTLNISKLLSKYLKDNGINVVLTRNHDMQLDNDLKKDLLKRVEIAKKENADLFISIHFNYDPDPAVRGYSLFVPINQKFLNSSYFAASYIHRALLSNLPYWFAGNFGGLNLYDHGIRAAKFVILEAAPCPAILIEIDYFTNSDVEKMLMSVDYQKRISIALAQGIMNLIMAVN